MFDVGEPYPRTIPQNHTPNHTPEPYPQTIPPNHTPHQTISITTTTTTTTTPTTTTTTTATTATTTTTTTTSSSSTTTTTTTSTTTTTTALVQNCVRTVPESYPNQTRTTPDASRSAQGGQSQASSVGRARACKA